MIRIPNIQNKKFYVLGLGRTGLGALKALTLSGCQTFGWDDNEESVGKASVISPTTIFKPLGKVEEKVDYLLPSPGIPTMGNKAHTFLNIARNRGIEIISDFDLLYLSQSNSKFIGITGTNGKSTTTALIGHILKANMKPAQVGGNIGNSVLELDHLDNTGIYVLESSSYQLDLLTKIKFNVGILLNITPDHLDRHISMENYINAKRKIFSNQSANDHAIISIDYLALRNIAKELQNPIKISTTSKNADIAVIDKTLYDNINGLEFNLLGLKRLPGKHNDENIAAAYAGAFLLGCKPERIVASISSFEGLKHRLQFIKEIDGLTFINDSKATNAEAAEKAFSCYSQVIWIAGGLSKANGIKDLKPMFSKIKEAFLIGTSQDEFASELSGSKIPYIKSGTLEQALVDIKERHKAGIVLFSPACASFDQFNSFEHRGDEFCRLVNTIFEK